MRPPFFEERMSTVFHKMVAIEPVGLIPSAKLQLKEYAHYVEFYRDIPKNDEEIIRRIGDADSILVSYTTNIGRQVLEGCPNLKYIGMCCSLYSPESSNVDVLAAEQMGITVSGVRDYGDNGVAEYVVYEMLGLLHGYGCSCWEGEPRELRGFNFGIVGLGASGIAVADALQQLGANIFYYSRTRKPEQEAKGRSYLPLNQLLVRCGAVCTCLNKHVVLLRENEFEWFGNHKILFNTGLSPSFEPQAVQRWVSGGDNQLFCDSELALGPQNMDLLRLPNVHSLGVASGSTKQAYERLSRKVLENLEAFLFEE